MSNLNLLIQGNGPFIVLSHALGCDLSMWDDVANELADRYTVVRYDHRGHGRSGGADIPYTINDLADDAAELIRSQLGGEPVHFVGLSMGGMTAQALGARHPDLVKSLVIANAANIYDDSSRTMWKARVETVLAHGMAPIVDGALERWFTPEFRSDITNGGASRVSKLRAVLESTSPKLYAHACSAVAHIDLDRGNSQISCPTLVIAGKLDAATPPALSERIANGISEAKLCFIDAAHLSAVEKPIDFSAIVDNFFKDIYLN